MCASINCEGSRYTVYGDPVREDCFFAMVSTEISLTGIGVKCVLCVIFCITLLKNFFFFIYLDKENLQIKVIEVQRLF